MARIIGKITAAAASAGRFLKRHALWILALLLPVAFVLIPPVRHFLNQNSPAIVAAFTAVLAFSTIALWKATGQSVELARRVATELERPYVYAMPLEHTLEEFFAGRSATATVTVRLKNIGRGPARVRHCICSAGLVRSESERPGSQHRWDVREFALGEGDHLVHKFDLTKSLQRTPGTIENLQRNFQLVYFSLWVSYLDAAGYTHDTTDTWRFFTEGNMLRLVGSDRHT